MAEASFSSASTASTDEFGVSESDFHSHRLLAKGGFSRCDLAVHRTTGREGAPPEAAPSAAGGAAGGSGTSLCALA